MIIMHHHFLNQQHMWTKLMAGYLLISSLSASAQKTTSPAPYKFSIDLNQTFDDKLKVELIVPPIKGSSITYHLPKIVPGTYSEDDFGRYIVDFKAFDKRVLSSASPNRM